MPTFGSHTDGVIDDSPVKWVKSYCHACAHFQGEDKGICSAFPDEIPVEFSTNGKKHDSIEQKQTGISIYTFTTSN